MNTNVMAALKIASALAIQKGPVFPLAVLAPKSLIIAGNA